MKNSKPGTKTKSEPKTTKKKVGSPTRTQAPEVPSSTHLHRQELRGVVVSDKMKKTIVVQIHRKVRHYTYEKFVVRTHKFKVHDETNEAKVGDIVIIVQTRPLSKEKRWALKKIERRAHPQVIATA